MIKILLLVALVLLVVLIYASTRPNSFQVVRTVSIKAAPDVIFPFINDFHRWDTWTPYDKDPAMKKTYRGAASGPGAGYGWEGNKAAGQGEIDITHAEAPHRVVLSLHMIKPFEARNHVEFRLVPKGEHTEVTWDMTGPQAFPMKVMGLFMNMDLMVGKDFEVGLNRLREAAEKSA